MVGPAGFEPATFRSFQLPALPKLSYGPVAALRGYDPPTTLVRQASVIPFHHSAVVGPAGLAPARHRGHNFIRIAT